MSDVGKIIANRKAARDAAPFEMRQVMAAEATADALEGIRQDLTLISGQLTHVVQQLTAIATKR
jgi:hypothetical protein